MDKITEMLDLIHTLNAKVQTLQALPCDQTDMTDSECVLRAASDLMLAAQGFEDISLSLVGSVMITGDQDGYDMASCLAQEVDSTVIIVKLGARHDMQN